MDALIYLGSFSNGNAERPAWVWKVIHKVGILIPKGIILTELEKLQIEAIMKNEDDEPINIEVTAASLIAFIRSCRK